MRKTVVLLKGYPRLSETFIAQELRGLELAGMDLHLVSMRHPTDTRRHPVHDEIVAPVSYLPEYLHHEPGRVLRALGRMLGRGGFWASARRFLGDVIRDPSRNRIRRFGQAAVLAAEWPRDAGWLHVHFLHTPASVGSYASRMIGTGWTVSAHAKDIWTSPEWDLRAKLDHADWCVTCTRSGWDHLRALAPRAGSVHLSYHGLNLARFGPWDGAPSDRDGSDDPVRLVSVGRLVPKKGYDVLLRALALLPGDLRWRFDHIGGGPEIDALRGLAESLGLSDRIAWRGALPQQDVLALYRDSDLFALPSRITADGDRDGLPNVMVEAASQRLCCIGTAISGIPELFSDGENGLLVPPEDAPALARALERAMRDPALRARLGRSAETRVRRDFDAASSVAELTALFQESWGARVKVMFYVQHLLGIGHLARASRIAQAMQADGVQVTVVTGGMPVPGFPAPGIAHLALPAIAAGAEGFADLVDAQGRPLDDAFRAMRRDALLAAFDALRPDVLLIEAFPFGRRQVRFELLPLLEAAHARRPRPLIAASVRDILQAGRKPGRDRETVETLGAFDAVLMHGDPAFARIEESFPLAAHIADKVHYTGLVAPARPVASDRFDVVVSAGGAVGAPLIAAAMGARDLLADHLTWCVLTGPNLPQADFDVIAARACDRLAVHRFRPDLAGLLAGAGVSVSQAGYNTVCDVMQAGCRSVLVPFASGGETEQTLRADKLAALGLARVLPEDGLSPAAMAAAIADAPRQGPVTLRLDGAAQTARILRQMIS